MGLPDTPMFVLAPCPVSVSGGMLLSHLHPSRRRDYLILAVTVRWAASFLHHVVLDRGQNFPLRHRSARGAREVTRELCAPSGPDM